MKFNGTAKQAIEQIRNKDYSLSFELQSRKIIKIGANVSKETRNIEEWIIEDNDYPPVQLSTQTLLPYLLIKLKHLILNSRLSKLYPQLTNAEFQNSFTLQY